MQANRPLLMNNFGFMLGTIPMPMNQGFPMKQVIYEIGRNNNGVEEGSTILVINLYVNFVENKVI